MSAGTLMRRVKKYKVCKGKDWKMQMRKSCMIRHCAIVSFEVMNNGFRRREHFHPSLLI